MVNSRSGTAIAVMSSKGGVGKTTISLGLAETIATGGSSRILLVDADPQGSITSMMSMEDERPFRSHLDLASLMAVAAEGDGATSIRRSIASFIGAGGSDVDGAEALDILPVGSGLIELERNMTRSGREAELGQAAGELLRALRENYDIILVDCSPGLYLATESWIKFCDFQLAPIKADKISLGALDLLFDFRRNNGASPLAKWLGIVINCFQSTEAEARLVERVKSFGDLQAFETIIPATLAFQRVNIKQGDKRSYHAKYPGASGVALRQLSKELYQRIEFKSGMLRRP